MRSLAVDPGGQTRECAQWPALSAPHSNRRRRGDPQHHCEWRPVTDQHMLSM